MTPPDKKFQRVTQLQAAAEKQLVNTPEDANPAHRAEQLVHELYVHQIELEMQNEQLRQSQLDLEASRDYFVDFYDFAPVGYLTLNSDGMIDAINLTGATLLGVERNNLLLHRFASYVVPEDRDRWYRHFLSVLKEDNKQPCELALQHHNQPRFYAMLNCQCLKNESQKPRVRVVLTNITDRKHIEKALADSNAITHRILDTALDGFWHTGIQGNLLDVNPAYCKQSGYTREELLGLHVSDLEAVESHAATAEHIKRVIETGQDQFESLHRRKDGSTWQVEVSVTYHKNNGGEFFAFFRDISERKRLQAAQQEAQDRLHNIATLAPGVLYQFRMRPDGSFYLPYASDDFINIFRIDPAELREDASRMFILVHPDDVENLKASILASARDLTPWQHEFRVKFDDGIARWLFGNSAPQREVDGATLWNGFITDITERKRSDDMLRKLSIAVEQSPASVLITDTQARIEYANPRFTEISGYSAAEVIGQTPSMLQSGQTPKETYRELWGQLRSGLTWHGELLNKRKNGELYWEDVNIAAVKNTAGVITHYVGIKTDITWRKQAEALARASLEIDVSREAVRNLATHIENQREEERKFIAREIHDELGQILSVLRMDIALLKDRTGMDNAVMDDLERDMLGLVDQAIQAVRNISHSLRPVQLGMGSIAALQWLCAELNKHSGISCALKTVDDIDALPEKIALVLFRIVQESLTNVTRHAAATQVDITITTNNAAIEVEIRDNGKGFDVKNPGSIKSFGLLGMSERAISIGGELNITSSPGQGTVVTLHIPNEPTMGVQNGKFAAPDDASAGK